MIYLILLLIIITSGSVIGIEYKNIFNLFLIVFIFIEIIRARFFSLTYKYNIVILVLLFLIYIAFNVFSSLNYGFNNFGIVFFLLLKIIFISIYISTVVEKKLDIYKAFSYCVYYLSIVSFIVYILVLLKFPIPLVNNDSIPIYIYLLKDFGNDFGGNELIRRTAGIFFEPGLYQIYLNFSLIYFLNRKSFFISLFLILNVGLTYSPTGYLLSFFILFLYFFKFNWRFIILSLIIFISFVILISLSLEFLITKQEGMSYYLRYHDMLLGSKLFFEKFIIGWGIGNEEMIKEFFLLDINKERGLSNGLLALAYQGGVIGILFYFMGFLKFIKSMSFNNKYFTFILFFILSLVNENIYLSNFFLFLVIYGYVWSRYEKNIVYRSKIL